MQKSTRCWSRAGNQKDPGKGLKHSTMSCASLCQETEGTAQERPSGQGWELRCLCQKTEGSEQEDQGICTGSQETVAKMKTRIEALLEKESSQSSWRKITKPSQRKAAIKKLLQGKSAETLPSHSFIPIWQPCWLKSAGHSHSSWQLVNYHRLDNLWTTDIYCSRVLEAGKS